MGLGVGPGPGSAPGALGSASGVGVGVGAGTGQGGAGNLGNLVSGPVPGRDTRTVLFVGNVCSFFYYLILFLLRF